MSEEKCKYCDKVISAVNEAQLKSLMDSHLINKHKDKVELREIKK